ncbi:MAG: hypothetical protein C0410_09265 [Anaerolinea sp.]|nr:hypothetical protein [Anaerolinea sp.]
MKKYQEENGQILIILAVALVAILGITALALDGSMVLNDRRDDQSIADSAALASASAAVQILKDYPPNQFYCGSILANNAATAAILAGQGYAQSEDNPLIENDPANGISVTCGVKNYRTYLDIKITVSTTRETTFAQIIGRDQLQTKVEATSRVYPKETLAFGNGIASLSNSCGTIGGITVTGSGSIDVIGAGIFTNSCLTGTGTIDIVVNGGQISYYTAYSPPASGSVSPAPVKVTQRLPFFTVPIPDCSKVPNYGSPVAVTSSGTINPGNYSKIKLTSVDTVILNPGLYCMTGDVTTTGQAHLTGQGVTIYFKSGTFDTAGTSFINLEAPNCETSLCGVPPAIRGILIYLDPSNNNKIKFTGTSNSVFMGTIFAPGGTIDVAGSGDLVTLNTQLIANKVNVSGSAHISLNLNGAEIFQTPSSIELLK